jgi:hypothetical protein
MGMSGGREYGKNNNETHYRNSDGCEYWQDEEGNEIAKPTL